MKNVARLLPLLPAFWLAACSGTGGETAGAPAPAADPAQGYRMKTGDDGDDDLARMQDKYGSNSPYMTNSKGKPMGEHKAATEFDRANTQFNRGYAGKEFKTGEFKKKSWWGDHDYARKVYGGDTDANGLRKASRYGDKTAGENVKVARDAGRTFDTGAYSTGEAREAGRERISKTSDRETERRDNVFTDPDIIPWQQQHGVTLEETKSKMGR